MDILKEKLAGWPGGRILEAGAGAGQFAKILTASFRGFESFTGVDVDEKALAEARRQLPDARYTFEKQSAHHLTFEDNTFDTAAVSNALHHLPDPPKALLEIKRVLRPGGLFIAAEMRRDGLSEPQITHRQYHIFRAAADGLLGISHRGIYAGAEIVRLVRGAGFSIFDRFDWVEEKADFKDPEELARVARVMDEVLEKIAGKPECETLRREAAAVKERLRATGIHRPPLLVLLCRKN